MKILVLGANAGIDLARFRTPQERFEATGRNSGNQIIAYGLLQALRYKEVSWDYSRGPEAIDRDFDMILVAAANFLHVGFDFGWLADLIEKTKLPCAVFGLGAQSNDFNPRLKLKPGTIKLASVLADRCPRLGVRGEFTAEVLGALGIKNVQIMGCPSYYLAGSPTRHIQKGNFPTNPRIAINLSRDVISHSFSESDMRKTIGALVRNAIEFRADYILQTELDEMHLCDHDLSSLDSELVARAARHYSSYADTALVGSWLSKHAKVFFEPAKWIAAMKEYDFSVGQRFHGNLCAIRAGTPAMFVCHDSRTTEMCKFLGLPMVDIRDEYAGDIRALFERVDLEHYCTRYAALYSEYKRLLEINNLQHNL
jgi:hypothetical protein